MSLNVLFLGEIVGRAGIKVLKTELKSLKEKYEVDLCIANAEGTTNGFGIGANHSVLLTKLGVDIITGGEKFYYKPDFVDFLPKCPFALRPANYPPQSPGKAYKIVSIKDKKLAVINLISSSGFSRISAANPFLQAEFLVRKLKEEADAVLVQFHCATTAEAATMGHYLDGTAACVIGTHNKVLTADAVVLEKGTAFISDNGRCGADMSAGGFDPAREIGKFMTGLPVRSWESWEDGQIQGVLVKISTETNLAQEIVTIKEHVKVEKPEAEERKE